MLLTNFGVFSRIIVSVVHAGLRMLPDGKGGSDGYNSCKADYELIIDGDKRVNYLRRKLVLLGDEKNKISRLEFALKNYHLH